VAELSEWLQIMVGEVARKGEDESRAAAEHQARSAESKAAPAEEAAVPAPAEVRLRGGENC
jgi:hypothetical protein